MNWSERRCICGIIHLGRHRRGFKILLGILIALLILYIVPIPPVGEPVESLALADSRFIRFREILVHYFDKGSGDILFVILHGFGASVLTWRGTIENLSAIGRVFAFDRPGFGLTERPDPSMLDINPYSSISVADLTCELLKTIRKNESRIVLIGHSAGGGLALLIALRCDIDIYALVLIAPAWRPIKRSIWESIIYNIPLIDKYGPLFIRAFTPQLEAILHRAYYNKSLLTRDVVELYKYPLRARDWDKGLYWLMKYRDYPDITRELERINVPVLIIHGVQDEIVNYENSVELLYILTGRTYTRLVTIDQCGHLPQEERSDIFLEELISFLEEVDELYMTKA